MIYKKKDLNAFADIVENLTGIYLDRENDFLIEKRLKLTLEALDRNCLDEGLIEFLKTNKDIENKLISIFTNNETSFFRDVKPFEFLIHSIKDKKKKVSIASIPSSTGQEPISIFIALTNAGFSTDLFTVDAYDIDEEAINYPLRIGYRKFELCRGLNDIDTKKYFNCVNERYVINDLLANNISFSKLNVLEKSLSKNYDIVFCRNLLFYFNDFNKAKAINNILSCLNNDGILVLGNGEKVQHSQLVEHSWNGLVFYTKK